MYRSLGLAGPSRVSNVTLMLLGAFALVAGISGIRRAPTAADVVEAGPSSPTYVGGAQRPSIPAATVEEFLAAYWGTQWPDLESSLDAETRALLSTALGGAAVPAWESLANGVRESLREELQAQRADWSRRIEHADECDPSSPRLNPKAKPILDDARAKIAAIMQKYEPRIAPLLATSFDLTCEADDLVWDRRAYRAYPFIELPDREPTSYHGRLVMLRKWTRERWIVVYVIDSSAHPPLEYLLSELAAVRDQREAEIRALVDALP